MALEITGNIELDNGLSVNSLYARTDFTLFTPGDKLWINTYYYTSKELYLQKDVSVFPDFFIKTSYDYDRTIDGTDLLEVSNQKIKTELEALGLSVVITDL